MPYISPTENQREQLMNLPDEGPVIMVNLLKFKPEGGVASYEKYSETNAEFLNAVGARVLFRGQYRMPLIGDEAWDEIILVEYPSKAAFMNMVGNKGYQAIVHFRTEALEDSRLWVTRRIPF